MSLMDLGKNLLESAKMGETEEVRKLMTSGAPFTTDWLGTSPLHLAAQYGHVETAEVLLRAGISRDARTKVERTPLHVAAQEGHLEIVELLLKHGADIEAKDMLKMTALHWAVERGHTSVINFLVKSGANVCASSKFFKSPINIAVDNGRPDLIPLLCVGNGQHELATQGAIQLKNQQPKVTTTNPVVLKPIMQKSDVSKANNVTNKNNNNTNTTKKTFPAKTIKNINKPIILQANLSSLQKVSNNTDKGGTDVQEETDSSANVLATLAALAEATAPNANITTADTLQWLETHGIQMLPADNSTIVSSALEGGQSISLTEAGKLALNWVKDHQNQSSKNENKTNSDSSASKNQSKQVFTIVTDQSGASQNIPIMLVSSGQNETGELVQTLTFQQKSSNDKREEQNEVIHIKEEVEEEPEILDEREKLRLELEDVRRQAAAYKAQLKEKEHEAEEYKRKLEAMQIMSPK